MATITKFEDLEVWKLARELNRMNYSCFNNLRSHRDFALLDQMNRSCGSIMDNIAEGFGRGGNKEFIQFLSISKGSIEEFKSQLHRAVDRNYLTEEEFENIYLKSKTLSLKIGSFINYLLNSEVKGIKYKNNSTRK
jgi:four helix bundle protein